MCTHANPPMERHLWRFMCRDFSWRQVMCHTIETQLMRGRRSVCFPRWAVRCVHADINKHGAQRHSLWSVENATKSRCYGWSISPPRSRELFFSLLDCVSLFVWVTTVNMTNTGPTLEVTPPCSPIPSRTTPSFLRPMGKRDMELRASGFMLPEASLSPSAPSQKTPLLPGSERGGRC